MAQNKGIRVSVSSGVLIAAPRSDVFTYLTNLKYHFFWNPHLLSVTPMKPIKLGSVYKSESLILGMTIKGNNVVAKFIQNKELGLENQLGAIHYRITFRLSEQRSKTRISCSTTVIPESKAFTYAVPILKRLAQRELQSDMQALKIAVEGRLS
jgi:hypothetical protein